jgi:hypothetical protein
VTSLVVFNMIHPFRVRIQVVMGTKCHFWLHIDGNMGKFYAFGNKFTNNQEQLLLLNLFSGSGGLNFFAALAWTRVFGK